MPDRLVICLDGTWNSTFTPVERENGTNVLKPTNPLKVARAVLPIDHNGNRQITYYDSGVGALGIYPGLSNRLLYLVDSRLGGGFGAGFEGNVEQAVNFIALNHADGAEIYVFGFSRGAAQARALTNFLAWLGGIPTKADAYYVPVFFRHYLEQRGGGSPRRQKFNRRSSGRTSTTTENHVYRCLGYCHGARLALACNEEHLGRRAIVPSSPRTS